MPLIVLAAVSATAVAEDLLALPGKLQEKVTAAARACAAFENGDFAMLPGAVVRTDLDGDLRADWVLNERYFACSSAASLYGSTGGTMSHFMVGKHVASMLNQGWEMRFLGTNRVLLAEVHGTLCNAYGYTPCVTASVWDAEAGVWRSAAANWEQNQEQ
jgi:hypothetical protein